MSEEDVFVSAFRNQRDAFNALANLVETEDDDEKTKSMVRAARRLAEVCEMLANCRIEQLEAEGFIAAIERNLEVEG